MPPAAWQALVSVALAAHRPEWLLRHGAALGPVLRAQPLAAGLALAQIGEDAAARAALRPWALHGQHGPEAALALWALDHKQRGVSGRTVSPRQQASVPPEAARAAEALLRGEAQQHAMLRAAWRCPRKRRRRRRLPAWLRLLQALPPGAALALLAALPPAARCGLLRAPARVREGLLALCGTPSDAQQPFADEVPAPALAAQALLAGTLALRAGRQSLARDWADCAARITARHAAAQGRPAKTPPPGLQTLLRLMSSGAAHAEPSSSSATCCWYICNPACP